MPRPALRLSTDAHDDLWANLEALKAAAEGPQRGDTIEAWLPEIRQMYWAVRQAQQDAETSAYLAKAVPRDTQRQKVYRAEQQVDDLGNLFGVAQQEAYLREVLAADWFRATFPEVASATFVVERSRTPKCSSYSLRPGRVHALRLVEGASRGTVIHELLHACHRAWYGGRAPGTTPTTWGCCCGPTCGPSASPRPSAWPRGSSPRA